MDPFTTAVPGSRRPLIVPPSASSASPSTASSASAKSTKSSSASAQAYQSSASAPVSASASSSSSSSPLQPVIAPVARLPSTARRKPKVTYRSPGAQDVLTLRLEGPKPASSAIPNPELVRASATTAVPGTASTTTISMLVPPFLYRRDMLSAKPHSLYHPHGPLARSLPPLFSITAHTSALSHPSTHFQSRPPMHTRELSSSTTARVNASRNDSRRTREGELAVAGMSSSALPASRPSPHAPSDANGAGPDAEEQAPTRPAPKSPRKRRAAGGGAGGAKRRRAAGAARSSRRDPEDAVAEGGDADALPDEGIREKAAPKRRDRRKKVVKPIEDEEEMEVDTQDVESKEKNQEPSKPLTKEEPQPQLPLIIDSEQTSARLNKMALDDSEAGASKPDAEWVTEVAMAQENDAPAPPRPARTTEPDEASNPAAHLKQQQNVGSDQPPELSETTAQPPEPSETKAQPPLQPPQPPLPPATQARSPASGHPVNNGRKRSRGTFPTPRVRPRKEESDGEEDEGELDEARDAGDKAGQGSGAQPAIKSKGDANGSVGHYGVAEATGKTDGSVPMDVDPTPGVGAKQKPPDRDAHAKSSVPNGRSVANGHTKRGSTATHPKKAEEPGTEKEEGELSA